VKQQAEHDPSRQLGKLSLLFDRDNLRATLVGVSLATVGLVTFWGIHIHGKSALLRHAQSLAERSEGIKPLPPDADETTRQTHLLARNAALQKHAAQIKRAEMTGMILNTTGGGLGLLLFGWIAERLGRKGAFILYHLGALGLVLLLFLCLMPAGVPRWQLAVCLPVFGFCTLGMHAGYAVYFPELYPTHIRGTGAGFCFNVGRLGTGIAFVVFGMLLSVPPETQALWLSPLFMIGAVIVLFGRETRGQELPE
jgi:hypothetical protein